MLAQKLQNLCYSDPMRSPSTLALLVVPAFAALCATGSATAAPSCAQIGADLNAPTVYVAGSAAADPLLRRLSAELLKLSPTPIAVVQQLGGSCRGLAALLTGSDPCTGGGCEAGYATLYAQDGGAKVCTLDKGTPVDVVVSDVFPQSCPGLPQAAADLTDRLGPVSAYVLAGRPLSDGAERAIQAEEAHFVFGLGQRAGVLPWTDETTFLIPDDQAGPQTILGQQIRVPPGRFKGAVVMGSVSNHILSLWPEELAARLTGLDAGLGLLPVGTADAHRADLRRLAFQAVGQRGAFLPDRRDGSYDKRNVRDGHYPLWGYLHAVTKKLPGQNPGRVADLIAGQGTLGAADLGLLQLQAGLIPQCAMEVARQGDASPMKSSPPAAGCGCWFEKNVPGGSTTCQACSDDAVCGGGHCRRSYCEKY